MNNVSDLVGIPFKVGGRDSKGIDCYGLAMSVYERIGLSLPDLGAAEDAQKVHDMINEGKCLFTEIASPEPWCLVAFCIREPFVTHVGVVLPNLYQFIHVLPRRRVVIERLDDIAWNHRIRGFYRWNNDK